ncbi:hypothetical protein TIFTF001_042465 [Ficus carica]|uniref:Uncharacterized protein n=1 Tax=Ficus carica TaxID=3494 RepID=A0AA87ZLE8_FICCA|nr:hypothetical protein TIFTF001_042465 [Ficus carica]
MQNPLSGKSDLQGQDRRSCFGDVQLGNDMVAREEAGLGDGEGNAVLLGVENDGYGGIRRPSEVSGEREEVEEGERERECLSLGRVEIKGSYCVCLFGRPWRVNSLKLSSDARSGVTGLVKDNEFGGIWRPSYGSGEGKVVGG